MSEFLSAGVFIGEADSATAVVGPVSTSTVGIVSWSPKGPTNTATLVTSFDQYVRTFGTFDRRTYGAYSMAAFFANGGRRSYVVRVVPVDAVSATGKIQSQTTNQTIENGDGVTVTFTRTASTSLLKDNSGASPIVPSSLSIRWRGKNTVQTGVGTKKRDGTTNLLGVVSQLTYEGRLDPATLPAVDTGLLCVVPDGTVALGWTSGMASKTLTIANPTAGSTVGTGTNGAGSTAKLDFRTGRFSILMNVAETPTTAAITGTYFPATATHTVTDDGAGVLTAGSNLTGPGSITYANGAYSFTTNATTFIPHINGLVLANYKINAWAITPVSAGTWANNLKINIFGSANYFTTATQSYSRYNVSVLETDASGNDQTRETYEDLVFDDSTSPFFFADVVTEFSNLLSIATPGGDEAPGELVGLSRSLVVAGGDDLAGSQIVQQSLPQSPVAKRTVVITYTATDGTSKTIRDDGKGNLTGDVDASYVGGAANTVVYATGALDFKTIATIKAGTVLTAAWYIAPTETLHTESIGNTAKSYTAGTDGTFDTTNFGTAQFTSTALSATYGGVYALDRIDELMQVIVPDFAGDTTATGDLIDYADAHASMSTGGDRFIILTVPKGSSATDAVDWFRNKLTRFSKYAALYWPWVKVADPLLNGRNLTMPALGHIAGIYARTDINRNVGKAPGGTVDGALNFLTGLETVPAKGEMDVVYPNRINPLISSPQTGTAVWGVRTISQDTSWKYINVRRLFMFLEKSIYNSTFWIVFENNGPGLWARIKAQLNGFLLGLYNDGYFAGSSPDKAFFVTVDETNNPQESIDQGIVNIAIGVAASKPAEFVSFVFSQKTNS